ncbi:ankyrin repeat domain-containing protein [Marimonas arenosa]|uniref:Ankyrin repeat protein n=1 Tax=Marimonas arenosa TaxID=1795305 RepID=A0AAE4B694_9RHOB|nr:hypothetical protein [Marimonas arenosa]MDQ2092135.1 hypothetical protein [Marimonas arenosa]
MPGAVEIGADVAADRHLSLSLAPGAKLGRSGDRVKGRACFGVTVSPRLYERTGPNGSLVLVRQDMDGLPPEDRSDLKAKTHGVVQLLRLAEGEDAVTAEKPREPFRDKHGNLLPPEDQQRCVLIQQNMDEFIANSQELREARTNGDRKRMKQLNARQDQLFAERGEISRYVGFTEAAEKLHKADDFDAFCTLLPEVALDRTYGSGLQQSQFPLIWALSARSRPMERVQAMLRHGARVDLQGSLWNTVLHEMAEMKRKAPVRLEILRLLVLKGADLEARNVHGQTPLEIALDRGSVEDVGFFLQVGARVGIEELEAVAQYPEKLKVVLDFIEGHQRCIDKITKLGSYIRGQINDTHGYLKDARKRKCGVDLYSKRLKNFEKSLEMIADLAGFSGAPEGRKLTWGEEPGAFRAVELAETLDEYRAALVRVDMKSYPATRGEHPIYWPIEAEEYRLQRLWSMLSAGASLKGCGNGEALHILARQRRKDAEEQAAMVNMLVQAGADLEAVDYQGWTPLACAVISGGRSETNALLQAGADVNAIISWQRWPTRERRNTPLIFAAAEDKWKFKRLVEAGADLSLRKGRRLSLTDYLEQERAKEAAEFREYEHCGNASLVRRINRRRRALDAAIKIVAERRP